MSGENVELLREIFSRIAAGDGDFFYSCLDTQVEWDERDLEWPEAGVYHGIPEVRELMRRWHGTWEGFEYTPTGYVDAGEHVVVTVRQRGVGKASGAPVDQMRSQVWTFRDGKVIRFRSYVERAEALAAAGLSEQAMSPENVEIPDRLVDRILDALNRRDADALVAYGHPEFEFRSLLVSVEGRAYRGREGFERFFADFADAFGETRWELDEIIGWRGRDRLLVVFRVIGVGRGSGIPFDQPAFMVWTFKDGRPIKNVVYASREELEAAVSD